MACGLVAGAARQVVAGHLRNLAVLSRAAPRLRQVPCIKHGPERVLELRVVGRFSTSGSSSARLTACRPSTTSVY